MEVVTGFPQLLFPWFPNFCMDLSHLGGLLKQTAGPPPPENLIQSVWGEVQKSAFPVGSRGTRLLLEGCREDPHFGDHCSACCGFLFTRLSDFSF